jgi:hypothetical protein
MKYLLNEYSRTGTDRDSTVTCQPLGSLLVVELEEGGEFAIKLDDVRRVIEHAKSDGQVDLRQVAGTVNPPNIYKSSSW